MSDADQIRKTKRGDTIKGDLVDFNVVRSFTEEIDRKLREDSDLAFEIVQNLLEAHSPHSIHGDILQAAGVDLALRGRYRQKRKPNFRANVLKVYENKCAVCGFDIRFGHQPVALEVAHIRWHQAGGAEIGVNDLALCSPHHKLFDRGPLTLSSELEILVSHDAYRSVGFQEWLMRFHSQKLNLP